MKIAFKGPVRLTWSGWDHGHSNPESTSRTCILYMGTVRLATFTEIVYLKPWGFNCQYPPGAMYYTFIGNATSSTDYAPDPQTTLTQMQKALSLPSPLRSPPLVRRRK